MGNFGWIIGIDVLGFEVSPPICGCLVILLGFEVSPPVCGCVRQFSGSGISFHMSYLVVVVDVISINSSHVIVKHLGRL